MVSVIQSKRLVDLTGLAAPAAVFDQGIQAGSIIVAICGFDSARTLSSLADGHGDGVTDCGLGVVTQHPTVKSFCKAFFTPTTGETTVTATLDTTGSAFAILKIYEVAGFTAGTASFDTTALSTLNSTGATFTSGATATLAQSVEFAVAMEADDGNALTCASPFNTNAGSVPDSTGWVHSYLITNATSALTFSGTRNTGTNYTALLATVKGTVGGTTYQITGVTRDNVGNLLASCDVFLLKYNSGTHTFTQIAHTISNVGSGTYVFGGLADNDASYVVVAWKDGTPHVYDVSDRNIKPV